mgnify:FL=1
MSVNRTGYGFLSKIIVTLLNIACLVSFATRAAIAEPLPDPDNGALSGKFTLPMSLEGADLLAAGKAAAYGTVVMSSHSINETFLDESLTLDGETTRLEFGFRYGLTPRLELGIRVPYVWHESGTFDSLVEDWHKALGLPQGSRANREKDLLEFSYREKDEEIFDYQSRSDGIGDIRLTAGYRLSTGTNYRSALRFGIKLPTGDTDNFHGSGGTDFSVGIAGDWNTVFNEERLNAFYRAHVNYIGEPDLLPDRYEEIVWQLSAGLGYFLTPSFELRAQAIGRTANYESKIETLGQNSLWLMFGANIRVTENYLLSLGMAEDVKVRSAPDVSFQLSLRYTPTSDH